MNKPVIDMDTKAKDIIDKLLQQYLANTEIWVYGSRIKGTAKRYSDLDLVAFASVEQVPALFALREAFEESDLPFRVDLFRWDDVPEQFQRNIKREKIVWNKLQTSAINGFFRLVIIEISH